MRIIQRVSKLPEQPRGSVERQWTLRVEQVGERAAIYQLHDDIVQIVLLADVINKHDVGVAQRCCDRGLAAKSLYEILVGREVRGENFDGALLSEAPVKGTIYHAHAAASEPLHELVRAKSVSD